MEVYMYLLAVYELPVHLYVACSSDAFLFYIKYKEMN